MIDITTINSLKYIDNEDGKDYAQFIQFNSIVQTLVRSKTMELAWKTLSNANLRYFTLTRSFLPCSKMVIFVNQVDNTKFKGELILIVKENE